MRGGAALLLLVGLAACGERDFDERYEDTQADIENKVRELDAELSEGLEQDGTASGTEGEAGSS